MFGKLIGTLLFDFITLHWIYWFYKTVKRNLINYLIYKRNNQKQDMDAVDDRTYNIFDLSDYSLLHIFKFVSSTDLYHLSLTCKRFEGLVKEKKLWQYIDTRQDPNIKEKVNYCIDRINERTKELLICSDKRDVQILPEDLFTSRAYINLTVLALENQLIRGDLAKLSEYPKGLIELSLRKSFIHSHSTFFKLSYLHMDNLKVLILDECGWVETYMLVPMSKYPKLEVLSLYKCKKLSDNDIAYLSLAGCFGFKQLRVLDIRFTGLGDQILKTFYKHPTLNELYFQSYISTYALDRAKRRLEIARGSAIKQCAYFSEYDEIPDTSKQSLEKVFGYHCYRTCRRQNLSSHGTVMYNFVVPNLDDEYELQSVLYKPPYDECKCGFENGWGVVNNLDIFKKKKGRREDVMKLKNIIKEEKYKKLSPYVYVLAPKLPMDPYKNKTDIACFEEQASENNKKIDWINVREPVNQYEMAMFEHTDIHSLQSDVALPLDVMRSFVCDPTVIVGPPVGDPVNESISEDSEDDEFYEDEFFQPKNWVSFEDTNVLVDELLDELNNGGNNRENRNGDEDVRNGEDILKGGDDTPPPDGNGGEEPAKNEDLPKVNGAIDENKLNGSLEAHGNESNEKDEKCCLYCGVELKNSDSDESLCKKCAENDKEEPSNGNNKIIRFKFVRNKSDDNSDRGNNEENGDNNLPSTSKDGADDPIPSTSNSNKRFHEGGNNSERSEAKKFKSNNECTPPRNPDYDLNISCDIEDVNIRVSTPNMFFIDLHEPEQSVMNVPMGGGLINILLGADGKTKTAIRKLSLRGYQKINDSTLDYLKTLKLDLLDVTRTGVSRNAVTRFIRQNPTCRVLHESACTCLPNMYF